MITFSIKNVSLLILQIPLRFYLTFIEKYVIILWKIYLFVTFNRGRIKNEEKKITFVISSHILEELSIIFQIVFPDDSGTSLLFSS